MLSLLDANCCAVASIYYAVFLKFIPFLTLDEFWGTLDEFCSHRYENIFKKHIVLLDDSHFL